MQTGMSIGVPASHARNVATSGWSNCFQLAKGIHMNSQSDSGAGITAPTAQRNPGDESAPGTPQTAEDICPECQGSGKQGQDACTNCGGSGRIVKIIGDA